MGGIQGMDNNHSTSELPAVLSKKSNMELDGSIHIKSSLRISVNDAGDVILIPIEDTQFIEDFFNMLEVFSEANEKIRSKASNLEGVEQVKPIKEEIKGMMAELDRIFGEESCKKIFGNIIPTPYAMAEFLDQMVPILQKYTNERQSKIAEKYSKNRRIGQKQQPPYNPYRYKKKKRR